MHRFTLRSPVAASLKFTLLPDRLTDLVGFIFSRSAPLPSAPLLSAWCEPGLSVRYRLQYGYATAYLILHYCRWLQTRLTSHHSSSITTQLLLAADRST